MEDEKKPEETPEPEGPQWEFKKDFKINDLTRDVVKKAIAATELEIERLRKQLSKLTYGG
jgi:polyhydroxyalkanoate synthesis regulator phasin